MTDRLTFDSDGTLDELVMTDALVHLEHLGGGDYMLITENGLDHVHLNLTVRRRKGVPAVTLYERFTPARPQEPISATFSPPGSLSDTHDGTHPHNTKEGPTA